MAQRTDLAAYRESIAARLAAAVSGDGTPALLGFEAGDTRWLVELPAAGEVLPVPSLTPVPLTHPWFAGLASAHGELQAVVDFSVFCGGPPTSREGAARLLRIGMKSGDNAALLVERVHGLKRADTLHAEPDAAPHGAGWRGATFIDHQGERWIRLEPDRLLADPRFLDAVLPEQETIIDIGIPQGDTP